VALHSGNTFVLPGSKARPSQIISALLFGLGPTNPAEPLGVTPSSPLYNTTTPPTFTIDTITPDWGPAMLESTRSMFACRVKPSLASIP
jgi:uncharacterized protein (TIGR03437 family)